MGTASLSAVYVSLWAQSNDRHPSVASLRRDFNMFGDAAVRRRSFTPLPDYADRTKFTLYL